MASSLATRVFQFLRNHPEIPEFKVGREACGNDGLIKRLRLGKELRPETEERIRAYLDKMGG